jgi:tRNA threonylcarbamoyladenosine biosynthesis protein TsaB
MADGGVILAIETSGATASVAVYHDQVLAESVWHSGRRHSAQLLPAIDQVLTLAGVDRTQLRALAVAVGPGSYAGLRVGVSTAMGLGLALEVDILQVPTLDVIAWGQAGPAPGDGRPGRSIRAAIDVGRGRFATARFRRAGSHLEHESRVQSNGLGELLEVSAVERSLLVVDLDPATREHVERHYGARVELALPAASVRRAGHLAELAALKLRRGEPIGSTVEPIYLHG